MQQNHTQRYNVIQWKFNTKCGNTTKTPAKIILRPQLSDSKSYCAHSSVIQNHIAPTGHSSVIHCLRECSQQIACLKKTTFTILKKKYKKQPRKVLKHLTILIKEKSKDLEKKTGHYFNELNSQVRMSFSSLKNNNKTIIEFSFRHEEL